MLRQIHDRLAREASPAEAKRLLTATFVLTGLRLDRDVVQQLFQGAPGMRESDTYQMILDEGRAEGRIQGERKLLVRQGTGKFGAPSEAEQRTLEAITDLDRLERMAEAILDATSWQELLNTP